MKTRLTREERREVLKLKHDALYTDAHHDQKRYKIEKLAKAWMRYIDLLDVDHYLPRHFSRGKKYPVFRDKLFLSGEIGAITRYLKRKKLLTVDVWNRNVVKWRKKGGAYNGRDRKSVV